MQVCVRAGVRACACLTFPHPPTPPCPQHPAPGTDAFTAILQGNFRKFDVDGSGTLEANELAELLRAELRVRATRADLRGLMEEMDGDGDGRVTMEEFVRVSGCVCMCG